MTELEGTKSFVDARGGAATLFVAPYLVRLLTADHPSHSSARISIAEVERVTLGRGAACGHRRGCDESSSGLTISVADGWMSTRHAELCRRGGRWHLRDLGSKNGTLVGGEVIAEERPLDDGDVIELGNTFFLFRSDVLRSFREPADLEADSLPAAEPARATLSLPMARIIADAAKVAPAAIPVLILGETGTGKEVTARFLHRQSGRKGRFVAVNCGALAPTLVESELFGHRKGAFSGAASDRVGLIQAAEGGTLFLDELAELPLDAQVALLRVLQEREVTPVGATQPIAVDVRVVGATHSDLAARVEDGRFRSDLYGRLVGHTVRLPPLRERREDLGLLISTFLARAAPGADIALERDAARWLVNYSWPRNLRELEQTLAAAVALCEGTIALAHLPRELISAGEREGAPSDPLEAELTRQLRAHGGNISAVAREMGKARVQIRRWCKRFGIDPESFRS